MKKYIMVDDVIWELTDKGDGTSDIRSIDKSSEEYQTAIKLVMEKYQG
jgi:hypothetical protein